MSEMRLFCTECWHEVTQKDSACPLCGADLSGFEELSYDEKLMKALMHFEPRTAVRAAQILAMRKSVPGAAAIARAFVDRPDLDIIMGREFLKAIADINGLEERGVASELINSTFKSETAQSIIEDSLYPHINQSTETEMKLEGTGKLLRIFIGEDDHLDQRPLYEVLVNRAKEFGMAGATVIRGVESYGAGSRIHTAKLLRLSADLPVVIEIVDTEEKIDSFLPIVEEVLGKAGCGGMITEEKATVIHYTPGKNA